MKYTTLLTLCAALIFGGSTAPDSYGQAEFGNSAAISDNTIVVGAPEEDTWTGRAYTFVSNAGWSTEYSFAGSNTEEMDDFGFAVAIDGDTIVVGAPFERSSATGVNGDQTNNSDPAAGAAYVFVRNGTTWTQQAYLKASNTGSGDWFGWSVAISGDTIVVGAPTEASNATGINGDQSDNSATNAGAAYVFTRLGTSWGQQAYLKASNNRGYAVFGHSVAISDDTVVVGAFGESSNATGVNGDQSSTSAPGAGAAYAFTRSGTTWTQQAYLKASNTDGGDQFGMSTAIDGDTIVVGAPSEASSATGVNGDETNNSDPAAGAAYAFVFNGTTWTQQAYLKAFNTAAGDLLGSSVAISDDTIVVGAPANGAGVANVFVRGGTTWTQQTFLQASNADANDQFGWATAIDGDTIVVGTPSESSDATGVNGDQADNSDPGAGAAYAFARGGTTWTQQAYLKTFSESDPILPYGSGCVGTGAITPALTMSGSATPGGVVQVDITNGVGSGQAFLFLSLQQAALDTGFGCSLLVGPLPALLIGPLPLIPFGAQGAGAGSLSISGTIPATVIPPVTITLQAFVADSGVPAGYSNTNGVEVNIQ